MRILKQMSILGLAATLLAALAFSLNATAQNDQDFAFSVSECEGQNECGNWSFHGSYGTGNRPNGETASLIITSVRKIGDHRFAVKIHRVNTGDVNPNFKADYEGTMVNGQMAGTYTKLSGPGTDGVWHAVPKEKNPPVSLPPVINFCDVNCITFRLIDDKYIGMSSTGGTAPGWSETIVVNHFTSDSVILTRTLTGQVHFTVQYKGQIAADGQSIINARNPFCCGGGQPMFARFNFGTLEGIAGQSSGPTNSGSDINWNNVFRGAEIVEKGLELIQNQERLNQNR